MESYKVTSLNVIPVSEPHVVPAVSCDWATCGHCGQGRRSHSTPLTCFFAHLSSDPHDSNVLCMFLMIMTTTSNNIWPEAICFLFHLKVLWSRFWKLACTLRTWDELRITMSLTARASTGERCVSKRFTKCYTQVLHHEISDELKQLRYLNIYRTMFLERLITLKNLTHEI